jgi:hypothetical protein
MRFKTFRNVVMIPSGLLAGLLVVGGFALMCRSCGSRSGPEAAKTTQPATANTPQTTVRPLVSDAGSLTRDQLIADYLSSRPRATGGKIKDALPRESFKVNIYADNGSAVWNRLKIDLDRDEKWDEKWDLENGQPAKRHVSTKDNEVYDLEYRWQGGGWVEKK